MKDFRTEEAVTLALDIQTFLPRINRLDFFQKNKQGHRSFAINRIWNFNFQSFSFDVSEDFKIFFVNLKKKKKEKGAIWLSWRMQKRKLTCFACLRVSLFSVYTEQTVGHSSRSALDAKVKMHFFSVFPPFHYLFWLRLWLFFDGIEGWACEPTSSQNGNLPQCTRDVWQTNRIKSQNKNEGISKEKTRRTATVS